MNVPKPSYSKLYPNSYDLLKVAAIVTMVLGHFGRFLVPEEDMFRGIGRMAMPLFLFLVGYSGKYGISRNLLFLGLAVSLYKYLIGFGFHKANILVTIFFARWVLAVFETQDWAITPFKIAVGVGLLAASFFVLNYGPLGFMFAFLGAYIRFGTRAHIYTLTLLALIIDYLFQTYDSHHSIEYHGLFVLVSVVLFVVFTQFRVITCDTSRALLNKVIIWISRHSLIISNVHYVLFATLSKMFVLTEGPCILCL